jgi:hypothetical protein
MADKRLAGTKSVAVWAVLGCQDDPRASSGANQIAVWHFAVLFLGEGWQERSKQRSAAYLHSLNCGFALIAKRDNIASQQVALAMLLLCYKPQAMP